MQENLQPSFFATDTKFSADFLAHVIIASLCGGLTTMPNFAKLTQKFDYYKDLAYYEKAPASARILMGIAIAYLFCPIDLIPDFIPVFGFIDDLVIVPLLFALAFRQIEKARDAQIKQKREQIELSHRELEHCKSDEN